MRPDINYRRKMAKNTNSRRLNNSLLNNEKVIEEISREIKSFLEIDDNKNMTTQNLRDSVKALLREKLVAAQS